MQKKIKKNYVFIIYLIFFCSESSSQRRRGEEKESYVTCSNRLEYLLQVELVKKTLDQNSKQTRKTDRKWNIERDREKERDENWKAQGVNSDV